MKYLIWSQKHSQWWGPNRAGYTMHTHEAGAYTAPDTARIVLDSFPPGSNIAVSYSEVEVFLQMRENNGGEIVTHL